MVSQIIFSYEIIKMGWLFHFNNDSFRKHKLPLHSSVSSLDNYIIVKDCRWNITGRATLVYLKNQFRSSHQALFLKHAFFLRQRTKKSWKSHLNRKRKWFKQHRTLGILRRSVKTLHPRNIQRDFYVVDSYNYYWPPRYS